MFRLRLLIILFFSSGPKIFAQNLFANAGFEELNNCTEYHKDCSQEAWFYIHPAVTPIAGPTVVPQPFDGKDLMIVPIENVLGINKRAYIYTMFLCPLQKDKLYKLRVYISTNKNKFFGLDLYMRKKEFVSDNINADSVTANIHIEPDDLSEEYSGWSYAEKIYRAKGDEKFCLIGNLSKTAYPYRSGQRMNREGDIFYFLDNISFTPMVPETAPCLAYQSNKDKLYAQDLRHTERALVKEEPAYVTDTITIPAVFFETDKAVLKPKFRKLLDSLSLTLKERDVSNINIEGHTDIRGTEMHNAILSTQRADAVKDYLLVKLPALTDHIFSFGRASTEPVADNNTETGRAKNRRVEIIITSAPRRE